MDDAGGASSKPRSGVEAPFTVAGEIDMATAPRMASDLAAYVERVPGDVVVECSKMTFIDSSGLAVFETVGRDLAAQDRRIVLIDVAQQCRRAFEIVGLGELLLPPG